MRWYLDLLSDTLGFRVVIYSFSKHLLSVSVPGNTVTEEGTAHPLDQQLSNPDDTSHWPTAEWKERWLSGHHTQLQEFASIWIKPALYLRPFLLLGCQNTLLIKSKSGNRKGFFFFLMSWFDKNQSPACQTSTFFLKKKSDNNLTFVSFGKLHFSVNNLSPKTPILNSNNSGWKAWCGYTSHSA